MNTSTNTISRQRAFLPMIFTFLVLATAMLAFSPAANAKEDPVYTSFFSNLGAGGYDVTAYFDEGRAIEGKKSFQTEYQGADWLFASQSSLDKFLAAPEKYAPQYGGYCAWAVAEGSLYSGDPQQWSIHEGKLYLNYDAEVKQRWLTDKSGFVKRGDQNWPTILQ